MLYLTNCRSFFYSFRKLNSKVFKGVLDRYPISEEQLRKQFKKVDGKKEEAAAADSDLSFDYEGGNVRLISSNGQRIPPHEQALEAQMMQFPDGGAKQIRALEREESANLEAVFDKLERLLGGDPDKVLVGQQLMKAVDDHKPLEKAEEIVQVQKDQVKMDSDDQKLLLIDPEPKE